MKKYLLSVFAATSMLFATSCSEEENFAESNKQSVTFKVEVEDVGASSRALTAGGKTVGQASLIDKVHYAVYEANGDKRFLTHGDAVMAQTENGAVGSVVIPLVNGLPFDIVFFAHKEDGSAFTIPNDGDLTQLKFETSLKANQESYDAFYKTLTGFQATNNSTTPVTLKRAVAQLNVGTTEADLGYADALKALATMSEITLTNVPTKFNARTGDVDEDTRTNVTFDASNILMDANWVETDSKPYQNETLANVKTSEGEKDFYYLAMAYVLAGEESALHNATFTFYRGEGDSKEVISTRSLSNVRLQRNYRTNVTGNVLTQQEKFDVSLDINFGGDEHNYSVGDVVVVRTEKQLEEVILKNAEEANPVPVEIQLQGNITLGGSSTFSRAGNELPYALKIDADQEITIDLNGFTISHEKACDGSYSMIENNGKLTILDSSEERNGKISFKDTGDGDSSFGWGSYTINNRGELVVEDGTIEHLGAQVFATHMICAIFQYSGSTTINGGTISTPNYRSARLWKGDMTINAGTFDGQLWVQAVDNSAALTINGGSFEPNGGDASSVFIGNVTNNGVHHNVEFNVTGGYFTTKIGCNDIDKLTGGLIIGGVFSTIAKENTNELLLAEGCSFEQITDDTWVVNSVLVKVGEKAYEIYNLAGLKAFRNAVNNGNTFEGCSITLKENIDLNGEQWLPIGYWETFDGIFDGDNHTISNLKHIATDFDCYIGLFGCTNNATIKNLTINNAEINLPMAHEDEKGWAGGEIGALVGYPDGATTIENINLTGLVKIEGDVNKLGAQRIGAVVGGFSSTSLTMTNVTVNVSEESYVKGNLYIGGVAGAPICKTTMTNVTSNIDVYSQNGIVGGIIGYAGPNSEFTNCSSSGNVNRIETASNATEIQYMRIGGIIGAWEGTIGTVTLTNCEYTGTLIAKDNNGNNITEFENSNLAGRDYHETENVNDLTGTLVINGKTVADASYIKVADGLYKKGTEYQVSNAKGLAYLSAKALTENNGTVEEVTIRIMNDIDMQNAEFSAIIAQRGDSLTIVGDGKTISNVNVVSGVDDNTTGQASMFYAYPNSTLTVSNLILKDIKVTADKDDTGYAAAVVGYCEGKAILNNVDVENATITGVKSSGMLIGHLSGSLEAEDCDLLGTVTLADYEANGHYAGKYIGTLAGPATINNCTNNVTVSGNLNSANDGTVYGRKTNVGTLNMNNEE